MSHELTNNDNLVLAGKGAWHGLGTVVEEAPTVYGALRIAGLDWKVLDYELRAHGTGAQDGDVKKISDKVAKIRSDTGEVLGTVGDGYYTLQNEKLAELIDSLGLETGAARCESAGSLKGGKVVFFLVRTSTFKLAGDDEVHTYTLFANFHDGSGSFRALGTSIRVVCNNTLNFAFSAGSGQGIAIRHTSGMEDMIESSKAALGILGKKAQRFQEASEAMAAKPLAGDSLRDFFLDVYQTTNGAIPASPTNASERRSRRRAEKIVGQWLTNLNDPRQADKATAGSVWSALNAVTQWADHDRTVRTASDDKKSARDFSNLFGTSADFKATAAKKALALV